MQQLDEVVASALAKITEATDNNALEALRVEYFGKKGVFTEQMKALAGLSPEERPAAGQLINQAKEKAQNALNERREALTAAERSAGQIDRVFLTGGSSLIPAIRRIFTTRFGEDKIADGGELTSIAHGLALIGESANLAEWSA